MIHVTIFMSDRHECMGFRTSGHAEMAESGKDIFYCLGQYDMDHGLTAV